MKNMDEKQQICKHCGAVIPEGKNVCDSCGYWNPGSTGASGMYTSEMNVGIIALVAIIIVIAIGTAAFLIIRHNMQGKELYESDNSYNSTDVYTSSNSPELPNGSDSGPVSGSTKADPTIAPTPTTIPEPVFTHVEVSSIRGTDTEGGEYSIEAVIDKQPLTKWVPQKSDDGGIGEWVEISADSVQVVNGIEIENGYPKDREVWSKNNRVKDVTISFSDGSSIDRILQDIKEPQKVDFGGAVETSYIRITINSIYRGTTWNDTAISEITAY